LEERKARLAIAYERPQTKERLIEFFERTIWPEVPSEVLGKTLTKRERDARGAIARSLRQFRAQVILFTEEHFDVAADAFLRYGKGRHPAALNFGDCMSYAVAALSGLPLLFTGNDFAKTDIPRA
jgi:ribonuclease VapC